MVGIHLVDIESKKERLLIPKQGIVAFEWSPLENFFISCEKFREGSNNLNVWDAATGENVRSLEWKSSAKDGPSSIKFDAEEKFCARQVGQNIIDIYDLKDKKFDEVKLQIKSKLPPLPKVNGEPQEDTR